MHESPGTVELLWDRHADNAAAAAVASSTRLSLCHSLSRSPSPSLSTLCHRSMTPLHQFPRPISKYANSRLRKRKEEEREERQEREREREREGERERER